VKGIDPEQLNFQVFPQQSSQGRKRILIELMYRSKMVGMFTMVYMKSENRFVTHPHLDELQGKGLGLLMYVLAAKIAHEKYGAKSTSSWSPSALAIATWERLVKNGWAETVQESTFSRIKRQLFGDPYESYNFQFRQKVVAEQFGEVLDFFLDRSDQALPDIR
jgi:hypothetical protein